MEPTSWGGEGKTLVPAACGDAVTPLSSRLGRSPWVGDCRPCGQMVQQAAPDLEGPWVQRFTHLDVVAATRFLQRSPLNPEGPFQTEDRRGLSFVEQ